MEEARHIVNKTAFEAALRVRKISQAALAKKVGANPKSFSRWINDGFVFSKYLWPLTEELNLSDEELDNILLVPKYTVCFRREYLGAVPEKIQERAIDLARTLFGLTYLHANTRFCPPNVSKIPEVLEVANQIRKYTGLKTFNSLESVVSHLSDQGVEVAVVPFAKLNLQSEGMHEKAFSVTDGKRCLIFLDASASEEALTYNLCHELCHLFRPDVEYSKSEERFCRDVASELVYPIAFFEMHKAAIEGEIQTNSVGAIVNLIEVIQDNLGGEFFGVALRLKELGFLSQKDELHQAVIGMGKKKSNALPKVEERDFSGLDPKKRDTFVKFWSGEQLNERVLFRFFAHVKNGALNDLVSPRKFSEIFSVDLGLTDELIHRWKQSLSASLKAGVNG